jgi:hypothetical protein
MRASLREMNSADGDLLHRLLTRQSRELKQYPLSQRDERKLAQKHAVRAADRSVLVEVPDDEDASESSPAAEPSNETEARESHRIQAALAQIGMCLDSSVG